MYWILDAEKERRSAAGSEPATCLGEGDDGVMVCCSVRQRSAVPVNYCVVSVSSRYDLSVLMCCHSHEIKLINVIDLISVWVWFIYVFFPSCGSSQI